MSLKYNIFYHNICRCRVTSKVEYQLSFCNIYSRNIYSLYHYIFTSQQLSVFLE